MRGRSPRLAAGIAPLAAAGLAALSLAAAGGTSAQSRATEFRTQDATLARRARAATLELYGLDSALAGARTELAAAEARLAAVRRERDDVRVQLAVAHRTFRISERRLGARLRDLYEQGSTNAVAVLLGSESLDDALSTLEGLHRFASQDRSVIRQVRAARAKLRALGKKLARREAEIERERARAETTIASLERARAARRAYLAALGNERAMTARRIRNVETAAAAARERSARIAPSLPSAPAQVSVPARGARTLTVLATGYALQGTTATGLPVGWGVVAVDPGIIPLGTRMTIPGYGAGVAADVGSAVQGATIDLWFPTEVQALAWGRRTVTITLH